MFYFLIKMSGKYPRKTLIAAITNEDNNFSPTIFIIDDGDWSNYHSLKYCHNENNLYFLSYNLIKTISVVVL